MLFHLAMHQVRLELTWRTAVATSEKAPAGMPPASSRPPSWVVASKGG